MKVFWKMVSWVIVSWTFSVFCMNFGYAQNYPVKPVRVVIPWPAGGSNDMAGRIVLQKVSESLGQQFVVDNRPGASGAIGAEPVAKSLADGYTLMVHSTTHLSNHFVYKKLNYDVLHDFSPISTVATQPGVFAIHPSLPVKSIKEFIQVAKSHPGQINYGSAGNGSSPHLSMALFVSMTALKLVHIPYKGGPPEVTSLLGGETQAAIPTLATVIIHLKSGRLRALGVTSLERSSLLPEVPTIAASGVPGYEMSPWIAVYGPVGVPKPIVDKLNGEINKAIKLPEVAQNLSQQGLDPLPGSVEEFNRRITKDYEKYGQLIRSIGVKPD